MKLTDKEIMDKINQHKFIIITGTSNGRTRIRKLLVDKLGPKRVLVTNRYRHYNYYKDILESLCLFFTPDKGNHKITTTIIDKWQRKKKPIIIDSFSDIQQSYFEEFRREFNMGQGTQIRYSVDWSIYKQILKNLITKLKKNKKQVILFTYEKQEWDGVKVIDKVADINMIFMHESDLIIQATDKHNLLIKDKPVLVLEDVINE